MALNIWDNFDYRGKNPLDKRMLFDTIAAMKNYNENYLPDITLAFNKEDGKMYVFNRTNDVDETTGKWREFEGGEWESIQVEVLPTASENIGKVYQYIGETTNDYTHNYFYEAKLEDTFYCFNTTAVNSVYAKSETPQHWDTVYSLDPDTQEMGAMPAELGCWDDATHIYWVQMWMAIQVTRNSEWDIVGDDVWVNVDVQPADYDKLENKPLEKTNLTKSKFRFTYRDTDIGDRPAYCYELEEWAQLYYGDSYEGELPLEWWLLHIDWNNYSVYIDGQYSRSLAYQREEITVIWETAKVNGVYKDVFRVENLTNVKINDVKDWDVFTFRDEGQSLYAWRPIEWRPLYSEKEIPEEWDAVYEDIDGEITQLSIDSYRWTVHQGAEEEYAFMHREEYPDDDLQLTRNSADDIIKEKYWTNAKASGIQISELPTATAENVGKVYQYIGADTQDYKHDFFYENKYTEGTQGYYAFSIEEGAGAFYATSETPSDGDPVYANEEGEIMQIPLEFGYWVVDAESPSWYSIYAVDGWYSMPTTRDSTQDIPGEPGWYQRVSVEVQEGNYDTLKNKPVFVGTTTQQGYGWSAEFEGPGGQTETYDILTLIDELPENWTISVYDIEEDKWFDLVMINGLAYGEDTVTRNSSIDQDVPVTTKEVNEKYYDIIGITEFPTPSSEYENKIYRYVWDGEDRQNPNGDIIGFVNQDLVICQNINDSYYWTKYGISTALTHLPTYWGWGYWETNNIYNDDDTSVVSYNGALYTGTVNWSTYQWTWEEAKFGKEYSAGDGIRIEDEYDSYAAVQWPCPGGFHIPQSSEWTTLQNVITTPTQLETLLHLPFAWCLQDSGSLIYSWTNHYYWNSTAASQAWCTEHLYSYINSEEYYPTNRGSRKFAMPIRAFKDVPVIPDGTWTETLTDTVWEKDGLISILVDTDTYVTVKDKNEWATVVYNHWDTLDASNCGKYFQWGNNYGFSFNWETPIATTVNTTGYSRENPYSSNEFHFPGWYDWSDPENNELWGATTGVRELTNAIVNTSMNESDTAFATVTLNGTTATLSSAFITAETFVDYIVKNGTPAGTITITVANGSVTVSSTATESLILLLKLEKANNNSVILN